MKSKRSCGIICCKYNKNINKIEVLIEKKRYTYAFVSFVTGRYSKNNDVELIKLFNNMTTSEKIDIMSLNFGVMWYRIWLINPDFISPKYNKFGYQRHKKKFVSTFVNDINWLKSLLTASECVDSIWELPKGRREGMESDLGCAIREFQEETGVKKNQYKILNIHPIKYNYISSGVRYYVTYFAALWTAKKYDVGF